VSAGLEPDFEVVGETADGLSVVSARDRLKPEVLIVDVAMPGLYGLEIARQVRGRSPKDRGSSCSPATSTSGT